jgi:uncharacterized membrane protein (DUF4010 family)
MDEALLEAGRQFGTSLAIGLLIGVERERKGDSRGLRTFALVCLFGTLCATLSVRLAQPALVPIALGLIVALSIAAYWHDHRRGAEPPTTSMVAMALTGGLGILCGLAQTAIAVPLAIVVASLLYFKDPLHGIAGRIGGEDLIPVLQFGALTFIVLPLLPDRAYGPNGSLNPHEVWLMVVLVAGVGLAGYLALRLAGQRHGAPLAAIAGGLVSSTATTLVFARHARAGGGPAQLAQLAQLVLLANLTMLARLTAMAAVVSPALLPRVAAVMGAAMVVGLGFAAWLRSRAPLDGAAPLPEVRNPTDLRVALGFGLAYGLVSLLAAWGTARLGEGALYAVAAVSGLTDVDAITLSSFRLFDTARIDARMAVAAIALAVISNLGFKAAIAFGAGSRALGWLCAGGFAAMAVAIGAVAALLR